MIRSLRPQFPGLSVARMCALLSVPRSLVYRHRVQPKRSELLAPIEKLIQLFHGYGYRRVYRGLRKAGTPASLYAVRMTMRAHGLQARRPRGKASTKQNPSDRRFSNLIKGLRASAPNEVWVADITAVRTDSGGVFIASIIDLFSRKVVAWQASRNPNAQLTLACLNKALSARRPAAGWIHHSDQGSTYTAREYVARIRAARGRISMSGRGRPTDNAAMESFYRTLKVEEVRPNHYRNFLELESSIDRFITLYNSERLHSSLDYMSPDQFEALATGSED